MTARARKIIIALAVVALCVLFAFGVMVGAAVVGYRAAMRAGYEAATIQNLKTIAASEARYFVTHNRTFGTLDQLIKEQELSRKFSGDRVVADGYVYGLTLAPQPDGSAWYKITADPNTWGDASGAKHFYFDSNDNRIRVNPDHQAGPTDPFN
ncbi:MAG TPA: hypothetical protein VHQ64_00530 [Pyrinomonadaceae bacterium]|jgi:hypothetical protein|nr:hypothetical protein [Pyrinomonadaceae bacterium]